MLARPLKFLIVGGANTLLGLAIIYLAKWGAGLHDALANFLGYAFGLCLSFLLNKTWTFRYAGPTTAALVRFLLVAAVAYALNLATVMLAIDFFRINSYAAQALGIVPYTAFTYLASRYFAFHEPASHVNRPQDASSSSGLS